MDALANAFADVDRMHAHACKAVGNSIPASLTAGMQTGLGVHASSLGKAAEQYQHYSGWVYVAIRAIASRIAGQPVCVGRVASKPRTGRKLFLPSFAKTLDDLVEPLETHPFLQAVSCPNPLQVQWSLLFSTVANLLLTGRAHWWLAEAEDGLQLWPLPSTWIEPADNLRSGWKLRPPGFASPVDLPAEDVVPFSLPDPSNPFGGGVSPLQSQAKAVATDEEIQSAQYRAFVNGIHPGLMVRVGRMPGMAPGQPGDRPILEPEQRIQITEAILKMAGGSHKRGAPLIVDGMIEGVDKLTHGPSEMDFLDSGKQTKERILQAFGVNPIIAGQIEDANRASAAVAGQLFAEHTVNPIIELISQTLTRWVSCRFASPNEKLLAWIEPVRANDPEQRLSEWKAGMASGMVTQNEYRLAVLGLQAVPGGDVFRDSLGNPIN
ncbi:MAG: phage portal protein [Pirellulales bacterium]|nr:phage portal protein [Pirellulales bacterium]